MEALIKINEANKLLKEADKDLKNNHGLTIHWEIKIEPYARTRPMDEEFVRKLIEFKSPTTEIFEKVMNDLRDKKYAEASSQNNPRPL